MNLTDLLEVLFLCTVLVCVTVYACTYLVVNRPPRMHTRETIIKMYRVRDTDGEEAGDE